MCHRPLPLAMLATRCHALWLCFLRCCVDTTVRVDVCGLGLISLCTLGSDLCVVTYLLGIVLLDGSECEEN